MLLDSLHTGFDSPGVFLLGEVVLQPAKFPAKLARLVIVAAQSGAKVGLHLQSLPLVVAVNMVHSVLFLIVFIFMITRLLYYELG